MGKKIYQIFEEFMEAGFNERQAFELTKAILFRLPFDEDKETEKREDPAVQTTNIPGIAPINCQSTSWPWYPPQYCSINH